MSTQNSESSKQRVAELTQTNTDLLKEKEELQKGRAPGT